MDSQGQIETGGSCTGAWNHWLVALYPLWQWLVLVPFTLLVTVVAAMITIAISFAGYPSFANLQVAARWARAIAWLTPMRVDVEGSGHIVPGRSYVVVANHQSQYDIPLIYGFSGLDLRWVMKAELGRVPFVAQGCQAIGHIFIDRANPEQARESINTAVASLPAGAGVLFFAEGTRSRGGKLLPFRKGAFRVAVDRGMEVLPVTVVGTRELMPSDSIVIRPGRVRLVIHPPIRPSAAEPDRAVEQLLRRTRAAIASALPARSDGAS